jgi:hypothetical protein
VLFDVHGAMTPYALRVITLHEWHSGEHLHERVIGMLGSFGTN